MVAIRIGGVVGRQVAELAIATLLSRPGFAKFWRNTEISERQDITSQLAAELMGEYSPEGIKSPMRAMLDAMKDRPPLPPVDPAGLNPGVRELVFALRASGFETQDSGDGKTHDHACDQPVPYVHILVDVLELRDEAKRLKAWLAARGVEVKHADEEGRAVAMEASYHPIEQVCIITVWNVVDKMLFAP